MPTIQEEVLADFLKSLREDSTVDPTFVEKLRSAIESGNRLRPDDLVAMYVAAKKDGQP